MCTRMHQCSHKSLIDGLDEADWRSSIIVFCVGVLAAAGGIGGGGLIVPALMLPSNFHTHTAVALSKVYHLRTHMCASVCVYLFICVRV